MSRPDRSGADQIDVEHPSRNRKVVGSNPTSGSKTAGQRVFLASLTAQRQQVGHSFGSDLRAAGARRPASLRRCAARLPAGPGLGRRCERNAVEECGRPAQRGGQIVGGSIYAAAPPFLHFYEGMVCLPDWVMNLLTLPRLSPSPGSLAASSTTNVLVNFSPTWGPGLPAAWRFWRVGSWRICGTCDPSAAIVQHAVQLVCSARHGPRRPRRAARHPRLRGASWLEPGEHVLREELHGDKRPRLGAVVVGEAHQVHGLFRVVGQDAGQRLASRPVQQQQRSLADSRPPDRPHSATATVSTRANHERHQRTP